MSGEDVGAIKDAIEVMRTENRDDHRQIFGEIGSLKISMAQAITRADCQTCQQHNKGWPREFTYFVGFSAVIMGALGALFAN